MDETTFFEYDGVKVTNARFVVDGQTFAMGNVTSVAAGEEKPSKLAPIILGLVGALLLIGQPVWGVLIIGVAAFWFTRLKTKYHIVLRTAGGEAKALATFQRDYLAKVISALNEAIVHRG